MRCILLLVSFFVIADSTEAVAKDSIDRNNLIRRKGASPSSQRSLHVQDDEPRIDAPAPDEKSEEAINGSKFYDMADWSKNDKQLLRNLLSQMKGILPDMDMGILHDRYMEAIRQDGPDDQQSPSPTTSRRRRLTEVADDSAANDGNARLLRKKSDDRSTSKKNSQKKKGMGKWDDEATVNWAKRVGGDNRKDDSRKRKESRDDRKKRNSSSNSKKRSNKKKRQNGDTGDDFYAKVAGEKKVTVSSDDKSSKSRKNKDSRKVDDHDYSESDDKSNVRKQKKKTSGSRKEKSSTKTTNKRIKSSFQPKFDESFRDSEGEVDIFKKKPSKKQKKKKRDRRLKSSKQTKDEGSSDDDYTSEPTSEPTYEATYDDSLEECPEHYYYDSDDGNYYPDTQYHRSKSSKGAKSSKGSSTTRNKSSQFKSAKRVIRRRELKSGKSEKGSKSSKASKGSRGSYDLTPCYPPGHGSNDDTDDDFEEYIPSRGDCDDGGDGGNGDGVPCPSVDLRKVCDKYDDDGSFRECLEACEPSFCCIHDALSPPAPNSNYLAPNCNEDVNCAQYSYCYIAWWKLADTIGPAIYLRLEQNDDFFDVEADEIQGDQSGEPFYQQFMLHHFNDVDEVIEDGTDRNGDFQASTIFNNEDYWDIQI